MTASLSRWSSQTLQTAAAEKKLPKTMRCWLSAADPSR
jgi:hypothetical protein